MPHFLYSFLYKLYEMYNVLRQAKTIQDCCPASPAVSLRGGEADVVIRFSLRPRWFRTRFVTGLAAGSTDCHTSAAALVRNDMFLPGR